MKKEYGELRMELLRKLQTMNEIYAAYSGVTNLPFVICDPITFNDQVWIFSNEAEIQEFAKEYTAQGILLTAVKYNNQQLLNFYVGLYAIGVNAVMLVESGKKTEIELEKIVTRPDYSSLPKEKVPVTNPQLQLTGLYFMQEFRRQADNGKKENLQELEEEMAVNLVRSKFIVAVQVDENNEKNDGSKIQVPFVKNKNDEVFQPVFTDPGEFNKFNRENKFKGVVISYDKLTTILLKNSKGIVVNPMGFNLIVLAEQIGQLKERFTV